MQHEADDALVAEKTLAEIKAQIAAHHLFETLQRRLVEAVHFLDLLDDFRVEPARAAIDRIDIGINGLPRHIRPAA